MEYLIHWVSQTRLYESVTQVTGNAMKSKFGYVSKRFYVESCHPGTTERDAKDDMCRAPNLNGIAPGGLEPIMTGSTQTGGAQ